MLEVIHFQMQIIKEVLNDIIFILITPIFEQHIIEIHYKFKVSIISDAIVNTNRINSSFAKLITIISFE